RLARLDGIGFAKTPPRGAAQIVLGEATAALPLAGVIDMEAERARLNREMEKCVAEIRKIDAKLANASFVAKAPPEVVEENRERRAAFEATELKLQAALKRVEAARYPVELATARPSLARAPTCALQLGRVAGGPARLICAQRQG